MRRLRGRPRQRSLWTTSDSLESEPRRSCFARQAGTLRPKEAAFANNAVKELCWNGLRARRRRRYGDRFSGTVTTRSTTAPSEVPGRLRAGEVLPVTRRIVILAGVMSP